MNDVERTQPFAGEFPTADEMTAALTEVRLIQHARVEIVPPFGDPTPGALEDELIKCRSASLLKGYPIVFKHVARKLLTDAGVELEPLPGG